VILGIVPGVYSFVRRPTGGKLFPYDSRVVSTALWADALRGGEVRPLAAVALDHNALRTPPVDRAELHLLNLLVPFGALEDLHSLDSFSTSLGPALRRG